MGYELHIVRRQDWDDFEEESNISLAEWQSYIASDTSLKPTLIKRFTTDGSTSFQEEPGYCEWLAHPTDNTDFNRLWLAYYKGAIYTKNPNSITVEKMLQIANALQAKVQGDDGEFYDKEAIADLAIEEAKFNANNIANTNAKKPWWQFW